MPRWVCRRSYPGYADGKKDGDWDAFFSEYMRLGLFDLDTEARGRKHLAGLPNVPAAENKRTAASAKLRKGFRSRAFGDGGYLDNKPFSHATSMLMRRRADCVVDTETSYTSNRRRIIPNWRPKRKRNRPDFATNVRAAVLDLPRQETIREDIERLYERNEMIERIENLARQVDADLASQMKHEQENKTADQRKEEEKAAKDLDFDKEDLAKMIGIYGLGYGVYHRLKVDEVTGLLAGLVARAAGHDPTSNVVNAIRELVGAWRRKNFSALKDSKIPGNRKCVSRQIRHSLRSSPAYFFEPASQPTSRVSTRKRTLFSKPGWITIEHAPQLNLEKRPEGWDDEFRAELNHIKKHKLARAVTNARSAEEKLLNPHSNTGALLYAAMSKLDIAWPQLQSILQCDGAIAQRKKADEILNEAGRGRAEALDKLSDVIRSGFADAPIKEDNKSATNESAGAKAARACVHYFEKNFRYYDIVTYPVAYGTGVGETNTVEVFRVSPEDATALMDERRLGRSKLAGRFLMSFGAFLDESWRKNDMLWGRLDGAERIICALLPDPEDEEVRKNLIKEAHMGILSEEMTAGDIKTICDLVGRVLAGYQPLTKDQQELRAFVQREVKEQDLTKPMQSALYRCLDQPQKIWEYYGSGFEVARKLDSEAALRLISRASNITGRMLEALAQNYRIDTGKRAAGWIVKLASVFWNVIGVAVPDSIRNLLLRHWLGLIYVFEFFLIVAGIIFSSSQIKSFGWQALGVTVAFNIAVAMLGYYISNKHLRIYVIRSILAAAVVALAALGAIHVVNYFVDLSKPREFALVAIVALPLWIVVGWIEWRKWIGQFLSSRRRRKPIA